MTLISSRYTLPETNIFAPANGWLEDEFSFGAGPFFRCYVGFREGIDFSKKYFSSSKDLAILPILPILKPIKHGEMRSAICCLILVGPPCKSIYRNIWVFPKIGVPQNGWFIMENPIKIDDLGVPLFLETPIYRNISQWIEQIEKTPAPVE